MWFPFRRKSGPPAKSPADIPAHFRYRHIELTEDVTDAVANRVIASFLFHQMESATKPISMTLDCRGGSVTAALAIVDTMLFLKAPIHVLAKGTACGIALLVLASGNKGHRRCTEDIYATFGSWTFGPAQSPETEVFIDRLQNRLHSLFASVTGRTEQEIAEGMEAETTFTAAGLVAFGFADQVDPPAS